MKYPQNWKKGSEALEAVGGRAGPGIQVPWPAFLSNPATSTTKAFLVAPVPKHAVHMQEVMETEAGINFHAAAVVEA